MLFAMYKVLKIQRLTRELAAALVAEFGPVEAARRLEHAAGEIRVTARLSLDQLLCSGTRTVHGCGPAVGVSAPNAHGERVSSNPAMMGLPMQSARHV